MVKGTKKSVYEVVLKASPVCSCPDFQKNRGKCKHIYKVLFDMVGLTREHYLLRAVIWNNSDVASMFGMMEHRMARQRKSQGCEGNQIGGKGKGISNRQSKLEQKRKGIQMEISLTGRVESNWKRLCTESSHEEDKKINWVGGEWV